MAARRLLAFVVGVIAAGCGDYGGGALPGEIGATPGGALDFSYVRETIERGRVPEPSAIRTEGLLSEHDLPVDGPPCDSLLCVRPARAVAPSIETGDDEVWLHVGFSSSLRPEQYDRPPLDLVILVDESGSMSGDIRETWQSVLNVTQHLDADDQLTIVGFSNRVRILRPASLVTDKEEVERQVADIRADGGWGIDEGITTAFRLARESRREGALARVMLYTCSIPPLMSIFEREVRAGAEEGIATTVVGVLLGYSGPVAELLGSLRGGSFFYTASLDEISNFLRDDFDFLMVPLAYDFHLSLQPGAGFELERAYGLPHDAEGAPETAIEVETLFASRRRGAIALRLSRTGEPAAGDPLATVQLSYVPATDGSALVDETASIVYPELTGGTTTHYDGAGTRKLVALVNMAEAMHEASELHHDGNRAEALLRLDALLDYLAGEATALADEGLAAELELVRQLRDNVAD